MYKYNTYTYSVKRFNKIMAILWFLLKAKNDFYSKIDNYSKRMI